MQKTDNNQVTVAHRRVQSSTTLNRRYISRPAVSSSRPTVSSSARTNTVRAVGTGTSVNTMTNSSVASVARTRMQTRSTSSAPVKKVSATELKEQAIRRALADANKISQPEPEKVRASEVIQKSSSEDKSAKEASGLGVKKIKFGAGRVLLALGCATIAVLAIVYFVNVNMPDISLKVAAMQTGIENPYPSYVPRDYSVSDVVSENGKITLNFKNSTTGGEFTLTEERSSWDSNALLANYVKDAYGENYTVIREQGLTLYVSGSDATWVNRGVVHKIKTISGTLTKKQLKAIAVSL